MTAHRSISGEVKILLAAHTARQPDINVWVFFQLEREVLTSTGLTGTFLRLLLNELVIRGA